MVEISPSAVGRGLLSDRQREAAVVRDRDPLLLAARQVRGNVDRALDQTDLIEQASARSLRSRSELPVGASFASTFSTAVNVGIRLNCWNTNPTEAARALQRELVVREHRQVDAVERTHRARSALEELRHDQRR
jgi:hypothetical protein